ncbi:hypothetical protein QTO34_000116 [Cnephaeus nilssonii]|uniref:Uncharacterized protein n=1 Tax=Cnephaeus nilssonii TaxID=3371016 RepID=A0AA40LWM8_CNENI|nr:hypothetical protein QTO34_000116 [Eptesicus nilssonii]
MPQRSCACSRPNVQRINYQLNFKSCMDYPISTGQLLRTMKGTVAWAYSPTSAHSVSPMALAELDAFVIVAEFDTFVLITDYVPNYQQPWDKAFSKFLKGLASHKLLVLYGNLDVAYEETDLRNPKGNKKNAGFIPKEWQNLPGQRSSVVEHSSMNQEVMVRFLFPAPPPQHKLCLHFLDLHDKCSTKKMLVGALITFWCLTLCYLHCVTARSIPRPITLCQAL